MKKVLAIAPYPYLPYFSGGQKLIAQFYHWLGKKTDLTVVSVPSNDPSLAENYRLLPLLKPGFSRYYDRSLTEKLSELIKKGSFDTIIWEHPYFGWLMKKIRKRTGIFSIIHSHNIEYQRFKSTGRWWWPFLRSYERKAFRNADRIFFITPEDRQFAVGSWQIDPKKCVDLPFGIDINSFPSDRRYCKEQLLKQHGLSAETKLLLFTGLLNYQPNLDALRIILEKINPLLLQKAGFDHRIIVCGKGLPQEFNELKAYDKVIYAGFIKEIDNYYKAADVFLNPVQSGGGIKTKMVEAIAYGATVVSTETGATGIQRDVCGEKLIVVNDNDWEKFADEVIKNVSVASVTPHGYYQFYNWEKIIDRIIV